MASRTMRRRLYHGEVDGQRHEHLDASGLDGLEEPLLGNYEHGEGHSEVRTLEDIWADERKRERLHWTIIFSNVIAQWAQWLVFSRSEVSVLSTALTFLRDNFVLVVANMVIGSGSLLARMLTITQNETNRKLLLPALSQLQEERLRNLQQRLEVPFDGSKVEHQDGLKHLWQLAYPDRELPPLKSELWKEMGWQGSDPSTDFRGGSFISLENLVYFAEKYPDSFQNLLHKQDGKRAEWEYPFAVAGINISFMLAQMLDLQTGKPSSLAGIRFLKLLKEDEMAFDNLYCVAFKVMDAQWLVKKASYMEFNEVLKSTRTQLERELTLEDVANVKDLPSYNLLR